MDDDDVQDTGLLGGENATTTSTTAPSGQPNTVTSATPSTMSTKPPAPTVEDEAPPTKPPRPLTEAQKNESILKEAFPSVDNGVIKAVLRASGGQVEPAFNALLGENLNGELENHGANSACRNDRP